MSWTRGRAATHARLARNSWPHPETGLPKLSFALVAFFASAALPLQASAGGYERTFEFGPSPVEVRLNYGDPTPGAVALAGEGSLRSSLPGKGRLTVRVPYVVGEAATLGNTQVAASYDLEHGTELLPRVSLVAEVDLPTAKGAVGARPGLKVTATKSLGSGLFEAIHVESDLSTDTAALAPSYRAAVGASFRLPVLTRASLDFVALRPAVATGAPSQNLVQLGMSHAFANRTNLRLGLGSDCRSLRASFGIDRRF